MHYYLSWGLSPFDTITCAVNIVRIWVNICQVPREQGKCLLLHRNIDIKKLTNSYSDIELFEKDYAKIKSPFNKVTLQCNNKCVPIRHDVETTSYYGVVFTLLCRILVVSTSYPR